MGLNLILLIIVAIASLATILQTVRDPVTNSRRWIPIAIGLLACMLLTFIFFRKQAGYISIILWLIMAALPSLGFRFSDRLYNQGNFESARRVKSLLRWLHPLQDWPWQDALYRAYDRASYGAYQEAVQILEGAQSQPPTIEQECTIFYFRRDWTGLVKWWESYPDRATLENKVAITRHYLRALGELGELNKLLQIIQDNYSAFAKIPILLDYCYLYAFAYCGRIEQTNKLLHTPVLENIGPDMRTIWMATAHCAAGNREMGGALLKPLLRTTKDGLARIHAEYRLHRCLGNVPENVSTENKQFLQQLERDWNAKQYLLSLWH